MTKSTDLAIILDRVKIRLEACDDGMRVARRFKSIEGLIKGFAKKYPEWLRWWAYKILRDDCPPHLEMYRDRDRDLGRDGGWAFEIKKSYQEEIVRRWVGWVLQ